MVVILYNAVYKIMVIACTYFLTNDSLSNIYKGSFFLNFAEVYCYFFLYK